MEEFSEIDRLLASEIAQTHLTESPVETYHPVRRPPMARLVLFDDGSYEGETIRIRADVTTIGRSGCDVTIPHDPMIAGHHLTILRKIKGDKYRWIIQNNLDTSGFWIRTRRVDLRDGTEFLAGIHKFRFKEGRALDPSLQKKFIQRLESGSFPGAHSIQDGGFATIENLEFRLGDVAAPEKNKNRTRLNLIDGEYWIGRGTACAMQVPDDLFLATKHVSIRKDLESKSSVATKWVARTDGGPNGMWTNTKEIVVNKSCTFQIGEQRCRFVCSWTRYEE